MCSPSFSCTKLFSFYFRWNARVAPTPNNANGRKKPAKYHPIDHQGPRTANATGTIPKTPIRRKLLKTKSPDGPVLQQQFAAASGEIRVDHAADATGLRVLMTGWGASEPPRVPRRRRPPETRSKPPAEGQDKQPYRPPRRPRCTHPSRGLSSSTRLDRPHQHPECGVSADREARNSPATVKSGALKRPANKRPQTNRRPSLLRTCRPPRVPA